MKKFLCLLLVLVLSLSVFVACGKDKNNNNPENTNEPNTQIEEPVGNDEPADNNLDETSTPVPSKKPPKKPESNTDPSATPAPSENKTVVTADNAPDVYLVTGSSDNAASISYHLSSCALLKTGQLQPVQWDVVKALAFRQCPKCNPPRYEGYIE